MNGNRISGGCVEDKPNLTIGDLKRHRGRVAAWVKVFDEDGEYIHVSKASVLKAIGADVSFARDGLNNTTPLVSDSRIKGGIFYIN